MIREGLLVLICLLITVFGNIETMLQFPMYCVYHGYPVQVHDIRTADKYTLRYFRIQAKNTEIQPKDKVVYLQHGLQDSSDTWIVNDEDKAPAFILANQGYDVWVGNSRGNSYSSPRINKRIKNTFWNFTFDQMAKYDLPAAFEYIGSLTNKSIHYIGHSQGTMTMFAALSQRNKIISNRLASFSALGPVAYLTNQQSNLFTILTHSPLVKMLQNIGVQEIFYSKYHYRLIFASLCKQEPFTCREALLAISQKNNSVNNLDRLAVFMGHFPSGSSMKNMNHFQQIIKSNRFAKYDYGKRLNKQIYNSTIPPAYNLTNIQFPVHLYSGKYDKLADLRDVKKLCGELKPSFCIIKQLQFGHLTFTLGKDMSYLQDIIKTIESII